MTEKTFAYMGTPAPDHAEFTPDARILSQIARGDHVLAEDLANIIGSDIVTDHLPVLMGKKILITGATGLIGSLLARTFAAINTRYASHPAGIMSSETRCDIDAAADSAGETTGEMLSAHRSILSNARLHCAVDSTEETVPGQTQGRSDDITIYLLLRNRQKAETIYGSAFLSRPDIHLIEVDLTQNPETWPVLPDKIDYMIHAAAVTSSKIMVTQPVETIDTALQGTKHLLALAASRHTISFVYISSMEVYGDMGVYQLSGGNSIVPAVKEAPLRTTEDMLGFINPQAVRSDYPESKRMCENMCTAYYVEKHVPVKTARLAQTFGAGILPWENRVFAQFARAVIQGEDIVLHTKGLSEGNYCYTADCVKGILTILLEGTNGEAYNVANEACHTTIAAMAQMVAERFGSASEPPHHPAVGRNNNNAGTDKTSTEKAGTNRTGAQEPMLKKNRNIHVVYDIPQTNTYGYAADTHLFLDSTKLRSLGWKPEVDLPQMYARMIASMQAATRQGTGAKVANAQHGD